MGHGGTEVARHMGGLELEDGLIPERCRYIGDHVLLHMMTKDGDAFECWNDDEWSRHREDNIPLLMIPVRYDLRAFDRRESKSGVQSMDAQIFCRRRSRESRVEKVGHQIGRPHFRLLRRQIYLNLEYF